MSETYQSKRERWQRLLETLPTNLREQVSLRNVEMVAALSPQGQARLAEAIQAGLKRLPRAVEKLKSNPDTSVADLLNPHAQSESPAPEFSTHIQNGIADLIQQCFPDMPRVSAEALANSDVLDIVRDIARAHQQSFESNHLRTDFVMLVTYGLLRQSLERLEEMIEQTPALRQAFDQGGQSWKPNDWRK